MSDNFIYLGTAGSVLSVLANVPMLLHLIKTKDSTGHSLFAWYAWQLSFILLLIYAIYIEDIVFTILQIAWIILTAITIFLIIKYKGSGKK